MVLAEGGYAITPSLSVLARLHGIRGRSNGYRQIYYDYLSLDPRAAHLGSVDLTDPQSHKLPAFSRMDLGLSWRQRFRGARIRLRATVLNASKRENVAEWRLRWSEGSRDYERTSRTLLPRTVSFSLLVSL